MAWWFVAITLGVLYKSDLSARLTVPEKPEKMDTAAQLVRQKHTWTWGYEPLYDSAWTWFKENKVDNIEEKSII